MPPVPCAIALGSNLGDSSQILQDALRVLIETPHVQVVSRSHFYRTAPIGPPQPDYYNACAVLQTGLSPEVLMRELLHIEARFGRIRRERWGPRLLDLDLILFGDVVMTTPTLQIPHPRMHERAFVLVPLAEIAAEWRDPISGKTIGELAQALDPQGIRLVEG